MKRLVTTAVHVVRRPANRRKFLLVKSEDEGGDTEMSTLMERIQKGEVTISKSDLEDPETLDGLLLAYKECGVEGSVRSVVDGALDQRVDPDVIQGALVRTGCCEIYVDEVRKGVDPFGNSARRLEDEAEAEEVKKSEGRLPVYKEVLELAAQRVAKGESEDINSAMEEAFRSDPELYSRYRAESYG